MVFRSWGLVIGLHLLLGWRWRGMTGVADGSIAFICNSCISEAVPFVLRRMGGSCAQAEKPEMQDPADPKVSHTQPP
ncbi:hypothetical protein D3C76_1164440 [compost metagenome]